MALRRHHFSNCSFTSNNASGLQFKNQGVVNVTHCDFEWNMGTVITAHNTSMHLTGNRFETNQCRSPGGGLLSISCGKLYATQNQVKRNTECSHVLRMQDASSMHVWGNQFERNTPPNVADEGSQPSSTLFLHRVSDVVINRNTLTNAKVGLSLSP